MLETGLKQDIHKFYVYQFFSNLDFGRGIFVLFIMSRGVSAAEVGVLQTVLFMTSLLAEVPTGLFADRFGRKLSVLLGLGICTVFPLAMIYSFSFSSFLLLFLLLGIGYSLERGADSALLFSRLESGGENWKSRYREISGRSRAIRYTGLAIATFIGGILQAYGWKYVFGAVSVSMVLASAVISFFREDEIPKEKCLSTKGSTPDAGARFFQWLSDFSFSSRHQKSRYLVGIISCLSAMATPMFIFAQVLFKSYGLNPTNIGYLISTGLVANSIISAFAHKILVGKSRFLLIGLCMVLFLAIATLAFRPVLAVAIAIFLLSQALPPLIVIHYSEVYISLADSHKRATAMSMMSLMSALLLGIANVSIGACIDFSFACSALSGLCVFPLGAGLFILLYDRRSQ